MRFHIVVERNIRPIIAAGAGGKLFDFLGHCLNFNEVLPGNETATFLFYGIFSVTYNGSFIKINLHKHASSIKCIFVAFYNFLAFKKNEKKYLRSR